MRFAAAAAALTVSRAEFSASSMDEKANRVGDETIVQVEERTHEGRYTSNDYPSYYSRKEHFHHERGLENQTQTEFKRIDSHETLGIVDIGILSPKRNLMPSLRETRSSFGDTATPAFDLFGVADPDKTNFGFLCYAEGDSSSRLYDCTICDRIDDDLGSIGSFNCETPMDTSGSNCYELESPCPNNVFNVCRYDTLRRTMDSESSSDIFSDPYSTERCRRLEVTMSKDDEVSSSWEFSYCMRYHIISEDGLENTCEMEVDGAVCSSCRLERIQLEEVSNSAEESFCATFDCGNTMIGYSGRFCNGPNLAKGVVDRFVYDSLPCDGGCDLCGSTKGMKFPDADFSFDLLPDVPTESLTVSLNCLEQQWKALTNLHDGSFCERVGPFAQTPCGCPIVAMDDETQEPRRESSSIRIGLQNAMGWTLASVLYHAFDVILR